MTNTTEATISARLAGHTDSAVRVIISKAVESYLTGRQEALTARSSELRHSRYKPCLFHCLDCDCEVSAVRSYTWHRSNQLATPPFRCSSNIRYGHYHCHECGRSFSSDKEAHEKRYHGRGRVLRGPSMMPPASPTITVPSVDPAIAKRLDTVARRLQELDDERAKLILRAREQGASLREIAEHAGMTHVGIKKLIGRHLHPRLLAEMDQELPDEEATSE